VRSTRYERIPIYICSRDRVACLRRLVDWLEAAGHERITILDNASTYEPLIDYLKATPHDVVALGANLGKRAIWAAGLTPQEFFVYTDPDIVPTGDCPLDAVAVLRDALARYPYPKVGLGLYTDDLTSGALPPFLARELTEWENGPVIRGQSLDRYVYVSAVDTTFAMYRPGGQFCYQALRTHAPYEARHLGWYSEANPTEEDLYYLEHAERGPEASSWAARVAAQ
jgi:hypothetical protein